MASTAAPIVGFDVGRVMGRALSSIRRNFGAFALLSLPLTGIPAAITASLLALAGMNPAAPAPAAEESARLIAIGFSAFGIAFFVTAVGGCILQAAIVYGVIADLNGRRPGFGECLSAGLRNGLWLFLLAIVVIVAEVFGYLLFIVPGLMLATAWIVAVPAQVVEQTGVFGALGRSAVLTRGHRWPIFALILIYAFAAAMFRTSITAIASGLVIGVSTTAGPMLVQVLIRPLAAMASSLVAAAGVASIYYELRAGREGVGPEALAAVFA